MIALNLDRPAAHGSSGAAALFELAGERLQFGRGQRQPGDHA